MQKVVGPVLNCFRWANLVMILMYFMGLLTIIRNCYVTEKESDFTFDVYNHLVIAPTVIDFILHSLILR